MATLTPEIAQNLMQRAMTTGVPTSEFAQYGGYGAVKDLYNSNSGSYTLEDFDDGFLDSMAAEIARTGVGDLSVLQMTDTPLTEVGRQQMVNNGISYTDDDLKSMNIPYEGFLKKAVSPITSGGGSNSAGTNTGAGGSAGGNAGAGSTSGSNTFNYSPVTTGQFSSGTLGPGNVNYQSNLIKSLRQADTGPMSENPGFTKYGYTPPKADAGDGRPLNAGGALNPGVLSQDIASADDVANWNNYSTYRTNSLNAKTPITSFEEWLAGGKVSGIPAPVVQDTVYDYGGGGGA